VYINREEFKEENEEENEERKQKLKKDQLEKLKLFNLNNYGMLMEEYDTYSPKKKIKIQLARHSVFSLELTEIEKTQKIKKLDELERQVLQYQQNFLRKKIWVCEDKISDLLDYIPENDPFNKKIETANITIRSHATPSVKIKMTEKEFQELPPQDKIRTRIMYCNLFYLEFRALEKRKRESLKSRKSDEYEQLYLKLNRNQKTDEWYTKEKGVVDHKELCRLYREELPNDYLFLEHRLDNMKKFIYSSEHEILRIYREELSKNYPYRKEILEEIQIVGVMVVKVLNLESKYLPVGYLQKEKIDARTDKYIHPFFRGKDHHVFNIVVLNEGFDTYSPKKKIDVGLANHYALNLQINAIQKWRVSRKMNEFEEAISENRYNELHYKLRTWDMKILNIYNDEKTFSEIYDNKLIDAENYEKKLSELWDEKIITDAKYQRLLSEAPYSDEILDEIHNKLEAASISERLWKSEAINETSQMAEQPQSKVTEQPKSKLATKLSKLFELPELCKNSTLELDELSPQNHIKYLIVEHNLFSAECDMISKNRRKLNEYEKIIFDSTCAHLSLSIMEFDDIIHRIFHENLPREYRKEILEEMKNANISSNVFSAKTNFEEKPDYM
jgi:hypothetical protein